MIPRYRPQSETDVRCPACGRGRLEAHRSCVQSFVLCPKCHHRYLLADLAPILTGDQFAHLAEAVGEHLANRV